jgi:hypothetical protein
MIRVHASEPFTVIVKQGHLPMMMFPPCVFPERCGFPNFHLREYITLNRFSTNERFETRPTVTRCERGPLPRGLVLDRDRERRAQSLTRA